MIVLNLACAAGHRFEGWFASHEAFKDQLARKLIDCPHCNGTGITQMPSGPHIGKPSATSTATREESITVEKLLEQLRRLGDASEDVGDRFAEEARKIHQSEAVLRNIKGNATLDEMKDLIGEGIPVLPIPKKRIDH